jgi:hypothetical protein
MERRNGNFAQARRRSDLDLAREAAGKGWLAVCEALNALLLARGVPSESLPKNQKSRIFFLRRFGNRDLRRLFQTLYGGLHMDAYYDGIIEWTTLQENFRYLRELLHHTHALASR